MNTLGNSIKDYQPAIRLTAIMSRSLLSVLRKISFVIAVVTGGAAVATYFFMGEAYTTQLLGVSLISTAIWLEQILSYAYHNSYYFRGLNSLIGIEEKDVEVATYDVAAATLKYPNDVSMAFCVSTFGATALLRSGLSSDAVDAYLQGARQKITADMVMLPEDEIFSLIGLGKYLLIHDTAFKALFKNAGIREEIFLGSLRWVVGSYHQEKRRQRWWSKDNLSRTTGIGREWAYGTAYILQRFSRDIRTSAVFSTLGADSSFADEKVREIESTLVRAKASNVLIIGEAGVGKMDLVMEVNRRMQTGKSLDAIAGRHMIVLDTNRLFAVHRDKQALELTLLELFTEATNAGNTIIVIENLSTFVREAEAMGVFIPELLDEFLALPQLQLIATDTPGAYHTYLETLGAFTRRFAEVLIDTPDLTATTRVLQDIALQHEMKFNILFTYAGLNAITTAADRYVVEGVMPDKAIELLIDIATKASQQGVSVITEDFVYQSVSDMTGVPAGPIKDEERDLLLNLGDKLHQQVIGQQRAIDAIARTMRRARAGIQSTDKPMGSFLFLGPTGVGKTETAKALANIFFGGEDKMQRIDMSEYSGEDALERLIGDGEQPGVLPTILREHPYCVLLLDEFEKATQPVHDVFLQVLDEGIFTDARGGKVNARNTIIIATSNAGSQLILRTVQQRKELSHLTQEIIDHIVKEGTYRPELINRFDNTIIFEPLNIEEQTEVAGLMLGGLYERVKEKGYEITVSRDLLDILVEKGYNPEFGARPMQRVLQDIVEEKIAQKIIAGAVQKGDTIPLTRADFTDAELDVKM
ncbi:MAG: ATP-dependent Clp protease ATP-binding subunit [Candidatus Kaiserbacteria bacterium]|nr:ATP-dependent Clp protease ATP-binding subunit [Candidatus Kaiserbacteria bacterium]MCB9816540.1 ATP-dependent Clp protease ATP-binding subunit [Candidatus Nomurabacteria bacterium]